MSDWWDSRNWRLIQTNRLNQLPCEGLFVN